MLQSKKLVSLAVAAALSAPMSVMATNGMALEGYGPIATGMGGASMAYDNGTAGMINNPATLAMMESGQFDFAIGLVDPTIAASVGGMTANSSAGPFIMPALGYIKKNDKMSYGVGMFAQGGVGTDYAADSFMAMGTGDGVRSEASVGRVIFPFAYQMNDKTNLGATVDYVWAGMDMKMAMDGNTMLGMMGAGLITGSMVDGFSAAMAAGGVTGLNWGRFDFSDSSDFTGEAGGSGLGFKLGVTHKVSDKMNVGFSYHAESNMSDLTTGNATVTMNVDGDGGFLTTGTPNGTPVSGVSIPLSGSIAIHDFQWPSTIGLGMSYEASDKLMVAADVRLIDWSSVMENFNVTFTADANDPNNGMFAGAEMDVSLPQQWEDQTVIQVGAAYKMSDAMTLRAGINAASNPVPDETLNPLFPATIENHITLGLGYAMSDSSDFNFSLVTAPEVSATNASGVTTKHSQMNMQFMYSARF